MVHKKLRQVFTAGVAAVMLLSTLTAVTSPLVMAAPVAQALQAEAVAGVLTGGQYAKHWLKITPNGNGDVVVSTEWDRNFPENNGVGFFILDKDGLASVLNGSERLAEANLSAGSRPAPGAPDNQLGAIIQAQGGEFTIVLFNDSATDVSYTLKVTNATLLDDSNQVRDLNAAPTAATEDGATPEAGATATETPVPAATTATTTTVAATATPAATVAATAVATPTMQSNVIASGGVVRALEMRGELVTQNAQHYFDLEPSQRDADITLTLSIEPQDSSELARRLNFWVLDSAGFNRYTDATSNVVLSEIAIAAGSEAPGLLPYQRQAKFTASGISPYVVIVYNNATIPGFYNLVADGAILVDDSAQTITAQQTMSGTTTTAGTTAAGTAATPAAATTTDTTAPAVATAGPDAGSGREGEPGGTYVVQSGDTLSLIARDIYGDLGLWDELCAFNSLTDCNNIEVGMELKLPTRAEIGAGAAPAATTAPAAATTAPAGAAAAAAAAASATPTPTVAATTTTTATETMTDTDAVTGTSTTTTTGTTTTGAATTGASSVNLVAALEAQGGFSTLVQALKAANLTAALEGAGPFTIFAPTDAAFAGLPAGALDQLLANPTGQLTQILLFHVLPGSVASADIDDGMKATTQQGKVVDFEVTGGAIKVNGANVASPDIIASNGVIHAIDAVILPPP